MTYKLTANIDLNTRIPESEITAAAIEIILADRLSKLRNLMFTVSEVKVTVAEVEIE